MTGQRSQALNQRAYRLAQATIGYNLIEGVVMIAAGIAAGLVSVIGFGVDSGIESISAVLVLLRVGARLRDGDLDQAKERRALKLVAVTFFLLAAYVIVEGIADLVRGEVPEPSAVGVVMLAASLIVMPLLAWAKTKVGRELGDNLILADAAETKVCVLMSASTLLGLLAFTWTGATWIDPVAGFVIAVFAIREGTEAWEGELVEDEGEGGES
jgi:divalent metal cation (Fe/Co/Zn/Cd) transporter